MATRIEELIAKGTFPFQWTGPCLLCDEIRVSLVGNVAKVDSGCEACEAELQGWLQSDTPDAPDTSELDQTIRSAAAALHDAKLPLICGLTDQSIETQHAAVLLAKAMDSAIDWTLGNGPFAFHRALQTCGSVSCTYGEVTERCDLAIFWPGTLREDYQNFVRRYLPDDTPTVSIDWDRKQQLAALRWLRAGLMKQNPKFVVDELDAEFVKELESLQQKINAAKYPVILVDESLAHAVGNAGVLSLHRFVRSQNDLNNCRLLHLGRSNASGIAMTMTSLAGAPFGVGFRDGTAMYRGREYSVESLLGGAKSESQNNPTADLLFLIGSPEQLPAQVPPGIKTIWLNDQPSKRTSQGFEADIALQAGRWGLDHSGSGCRADGVPIERTKLSIGNSPSPAELLRRLTTG